ncbi:MAG TPA: lytic transglycosylase domain-containing protein [Puia sp.]|uniref:lytic transglycosylase domain-containing protein n=1 Tax=Puia sp. TaxID=2045100 RepID=UPI002BB255D8|nr:lytic transglycosylase domain-containing protein [Puia sp.]HVU98372.1 lytic transglycosylase domain-containing protein [Puia sp.]
MSVCFYPIALVVATPTAANPERNSRSESKDSSRGGDSPESSKTVHYSTGFSHSQKMAFTPPDKKGLKFVNSYIRHNDDCLTDVRERSEEPFSVIDSVLLRYHLPLELKYLAVIESELKTTAVSRVGAKGTWQLMRGTAHELGLKVNRQTDERKDLVKSTRAAAAYLRDLHHEFKDWLLVLAAYNGGPVPVIRAMHKAHSRNFWILQKYLPAESRMHVKKFIATAMYFEKQDEDKPAPTAPETETDDEKFSRLMRESASSLEVSRHQLGEK